MPALRSSGSTSQDDSEKESTGRRYPRRSAKSSSQPGELNEAVGLSTEDEDNKDPAASSNDDDEEPMDVEGEEQDDDDNDDGRKRRPKRTGGRRKMRTDEDDNDEDEEETIVRRMSSRSNKFKNSMKEPNTESVRDLFQASSVSSKKKSKTESKSKGRRSRPRNNSNNDDDSRDPTTAEESSDSDDSIDQPKRRNVKRRQTTLNFVPQHKSPARRHAQARRSVPNEFSSEEDQDSESHHEDMEEIRIQRILAVRSETKGAWREICKKMNTSEITDGSRWFQTEDDGRSDDDVIEERFLVKWADLSYLHTSWETQSDLMAETEGAKVYIKTFFRKSVNGLLLTQDERCDGDYFDPSLVQVDRILSVGYDYDEGGKEKKIKQISTAEEEDGCVPTDFGIITDRTHPDYESGTGRQFLIKWQNSSYSETSYEFERDLMLNDVEYKEKLKDFYRRRTKPQKKDLKQLAKAAEDAKRTHYKIFGDKSKMGDEERDEELQSYQKTLREHIYPNGGQLRDYQAEGIAWMMSNYVNQRSCILADEMGLGKTLQTAAFMDIVVRKCHRPGPFLVVVPLSTAGHWQREFSSWTNLNTVVYHGSLEDRRLLREYEFPYESDRPSRGVGANQLYLKKCRNASGTWMVQVVITTPEILVAEDWNELTAIKWEVLVVDEAHRLKNHASKLAVNLRKDEFVFKHKILLTGTPIQNEVKEFWTLLNFIDPVMYDDLNSFLELYGDIKSKERIDELHEKIRPYILRRLKEDVEKSVPPKEETLIEVELTVLQKQYYRALYEGNLKFLHKKKRAIDGPSLNNLAMQLRKCCNHLFLLHGVEEELRNDKMKDGNMTEADFLVRGSGKLVLLDKLLPRLKEKGHRILIFSQFKIMLDVLEDYLHLREMKYERIDGSVTGRKRQQAIDRFQNSEGKEPPFIMLLSTRAGGVGINLTAADTCIIFDSDWNPQNDLQAQARCHRIGQTKSVKVYRLLSRKSYEMQMFHMSSLKMGLDQAVLKGFETGASGESSLTKEEVERLLRHGAYDIFNEEKAGKAEAESNEFVQQDIDSILERRSRTVVHKNTGSESNAAGGTFSKASFKATRTSEGEKGDSGEDIDIEDPEFWTKMVGEAPVESVSDLKPRKRNRTNYSEQLAEKKLDTVASDFGSDKDSSSGYGSADDDSSGDDAVVGDVLKERAHWGGAKGKNWKRDQADSVFKGLETYGYGNLPWHQFHEKLGKCKQMKTEEVRRMCWSMILLVIYECAIDDAAGLRKRAERTALRKRSEAGDADPGGSITFSIPDQKALVETAFQKLWTVNLSWIGMVLDDALNFAIKNPPRNHEVFDEPERDNEISRLFYSKLWPALKGRGWKEEEVGYGKYFMFGDRRFPTTKSVLNHVLSIHRELTNMVLPILSALESSRKLDEDRECKLREQHLTLNLNNANATTIDSFLKKYAPLPLLVDRNSLRKMNLSRRVLSACLYMRIATKLVGRSKLLGGEVPDSLVRLLQTDSRGVLPHPQWTTTHDAILVYAVQKHGWIDRDKSCRAIMSDPSVKWGRPFEAVDVAGNRDVSKMNNAEREKNETMKKISVRAASFLNDNQDLLHDLKGCNQELIIKSYGLKQETVGTDSNSEPTKIEWVVDDTLLQKVLTENVEESDAGDVPLDLPPKKDLAKRAKRVLLKAAVNLDSDPTGSRALHARHRTETKVRLHGFSIIDQQDPSCLLLAEIVRAILKAFQGRMSRQVRFLCSLAFEEAVFLQKHFECSLESTGAHTNQLNAQEMQRIKEHLALVKKCMTSSARQSKNVLRVLLGVEPVSPKSPSEGLFPDTKECQQATESFKDQNRQDSPNRDDGALGERAIIRAMKKACDKSVEGPCTFAMVNEAEIGLPLTMIEALILFTFCTEGIPVNQALNDLSGGSNSPQKYELNWNDIGNVLELAAKDYHQCAVDKLQKMRSSFLKFVNHPDDSQAKSVAKKKLDFFVQDEAAKRLAAKQAEEFAADPEKLAKKSIMALEKVRRFGGSVAAQAKNSHKLENGLGPKIPVWFGKSLAAWAKHFEIIEGSGKPLAYTTKELLDEKPELLRTPVAAILDKKACRQVSNQVSLLTRLRSLFVRNTEDQLRIKLTQAIKNSSKIDEAWEKRPVWWCDSSEESISGHNFLLLQRLAEHGFLNVLSDASGFGSQDMVQDHPLSLKDLGLSKVVIQQKVNQLVRELHLLEESEEMMRLLKERRNRALKKHDFEKSRSETVSSGGGVQTELHAFFVSTKAVPKKENVVILSDNEEDDAHCMSRANGKRKEADEEEQAQSSAEKKSRKCSESSSDSDALQTGKRKDEGDNSFSKPSTPEKKQRTVVDPD